MADISLDGLLEKVPSQFGLVVLAAKRARQIKDGAPKLIETESVNPVTIAMEEIMAGKVELEGTRAYLLDEQGNRILTAPSSHELDGLLGVGGEADDMDGIDGLSDERLSRMADELFGSIGAGADEDDDTDVSTE